MTPAPPLDALQSALDYHFRSSRLLEEALTHKSYVNEQRPAAASDNERLEFLGDAVLSLVVSEPPAAPCGAAGGGRRCCRTRRRGPSPSIRPDSSVSRCWLASPGVSSWGRAF